MDNVDRNKLLLEYQKLLKRLDSAERWAIDNNFYWDDVKKYKYKSIHVNFTNKKRTVTPALIIPLQILFLLLYYLLLTKSYIYTSSHHPN